MKSSIIIFVLLTISLTEAGENGAAFLNIPTDTRSVSLAGATTASDKNIGSIFYNPAGLSNMERSVNLFFTTRFGFFDSRFNVLAAAYKHSIGTFAIGIISLGIDKIQARDHLNNYLGDMNSTQNAYLLSYSRKILNSYSIGVTAKYVRINFDMINCNESGSGFGLDLGMIYRINSELKFGAYLQDDFNIKWNTEVCDNVPLNFKIGTEYSPGFLDNKARLNLDFTQRHNYPLVMNIGCEYILGFKDILESLAVRIGAANLYIESRDLGVTAAELIESNFSFTAGFGVSTTISNFNFKMDYAFKTHAYLDNMHFTGITLGY